MSRNPKLDPAPGDVLCADDGDCVVVVNDVTNGRVKHILRVYKCADQHYDVAIEEWRKLAASPRTVTLAERIAKVERERAEATERIAALDKRIAWLRGEP